MAAQRDEADPLYDLLAHLFILIEEGDRRFFADYGLTKPRYYALRHLAEKPDLTLTDLAARMLCTKGNATRIIQGLEGEGYVQRAPNPADSRSQLLALTPEGEVLLDQVNQAFLASCVERFGEADAALLSRLEDLKQRLRSALDG